jgi:flagellar biosynthesis protein FlhF
VISDVIKPPRNPDGSPVYTAEQLSGGRRPDAGGGHASGRSSTRDSEIAASALAAASANAAEMTKLITEMAQVKNLLQSHLASNFWSSLQQNAPAHAEVVKTLINAGFSPKLCADIVQAIPREGEPEQLLKRVSDIIEALIKTQDPIDVFDEGGVFTFIGPTGVGKTTTVAKIAARCVVRHGADKLALLTTDGYRIGAHEQLRIYGKLLGVRVTAVKDATDLQFALEDLRGKHLVLIDTVGMSQRDQMVQEQMAMLAQAGTDLRRLLLLNAAGNGRTLDDVMRVYGGKQAHGCIITKTDEAVGIATALDVVIRHHMPLHYVTDGQRVPEDLHLPDRAALLDAALAPVTTPSVHQLESQECQLLLAGTAAALETGAALA